MSNDLTDKVEGEYVTVRGAPHTTESFRFLQQV